MPLYPKRLRIPLGWEIHGQAAAALSRQPMETIPSLLWEARGAPGLGEAAAASRAASVPCQGISALLLQLGLQDPGIHLTLLRFHLLVTEFHLSPEPSHLCLPSLCCIFLLTSGKYRMVWGRRDLTAHFVPPPLSHTHPVLD